MSAIYIKQRQVLWAQRRGLHLIGSAGDRGERAYTASLKDNLFEVPTKEALRELRAGSGNELGDGSKPAKMQAVHSSSALGCNVFHYWKRLGTAGPVAHALGLPEAGGAEIRFERKYPVDEIKGIPPNTDVAIVYPSGRRMREVGIECKFSEPYGEYRRSGLKPAYLKLAEPWNAVPRCRRLAEDISPDDNLFKHLHAAQLLKHLLGLVSFTGHLARFRLVYLWYEVPGPKGALHREEVERFSESVHADGVGFSALTYQELIVKLAKDQRDRHLPYIDYLTERYL